MMKRKYDTGLFADRIQRIRQTDPSAFIGIDLIVGVPGETEERFRESYNFAASLDVSFIHVFTYSERENTLAVRQKPVVPNAIRKHRSREFHSLCEQTSRRFYQRHAGEVRPVLFESSIQKGMIHGFTDNYLRVAVPSDPELINQIKYVRLDSVNENGIFIGKIQKP
jgi:threonylcarbamoyladenosine tRNA methylthiotransferase MtaB